MGQFQILGYRGTLTLVRGAFGLHVSSSGVSTTSETSPAIYFLPASHWIHIVQFDSSHASTHGIWLREVAPYGYTKCAVGTSLSYVGTVIS